MSVHTEEAASGKSRLKFSAQNPEAFSTSPPVLLSLLLSPPDSTSPPVLPSPPASFSVESST
eukprot:CAMPEP_0171787520 /NCGR_PEP_ID=MMETSP0991-20121206/63953_1 /TAXON_ID=483369 /ORGANISM="non described non described, Strain CCMP2098" /LENGTH=61 /DNA_ID=CAMNT_0012396495 /DNA_START=142 /DNA_END=327 /DNA_ORIENTATION=+